RRCQQPSRNRYNCGRRSRCEHRGAASGWETETVREGEETIQIVSGCQHWKETDAARDKYWLVKSLWSLSSTRSPSMSTRDLRSLLSRSLQIRGLEVLP